MTLNEKQTRQLLAAILSPAVEAASDAMRLLNRYQLRNDVSDELAAEANRAEEGLKRAYREMEKAADEANLNEIELPPQALTAWTWEDLEAAVAVPDGGDDD
jgi:hypothetical protein